jgi:hypothetical protein
MIMAEMPHPLRTACNNCPEPEGGRGILRSDGHQDVLTCAICGTLHSITPHVRRAEDVDRSVPCPVCGKALLENGPCPHCGVPRQGIDAVWALREHHLATLAELAAAHQRVVESYTTRHEQMIKLVVGTFPRSG